MSAELEKRVNEHEYRLTSQEESSGRLIASIDKLTDAMNNQATQFAVYASQHDTAMSEIKAIKNKQDSQSESIAAMKPVVDGVRGLVWKVVGSSLAGGFGVAAIIVAVFGGQG